MFGRLTYEDWATIIGVGAFFLFFLAFIYFVVRVYRAPKKKVDHAASLPLQDDQPYESSKDSLSQS